MIKCLNKAKRIRFRLKKCNKSNLPRLFVHITEKHAYASIAIGGKIIVSYSSQNVKDVENFKSYNVEGAKYIGKKIAQLAIEKDINNVYFDRGEKKYHGRVKAIADGAREGNLRF